MINAISGAKRETKSLLELQCKRCDWKWVARSRHPKACPNCKRYDWNK